MFCSTSALSSRQKITCYWPNFSLWCKVSCEYSTQNKKLTLANTQRNTHKCLISGIFLKLKDSWIPYTHCHFSHWWWGFVCLVRIQGFFTPHIGPHIDVVITSSPPSFHLFQFGTCSCRWAKNMTQKESSNFQLGRIHATYSKNLSKSKVIKTIVSLGKTIFLKFTSFPFYSCSCKHHAHSMPHNLPFYSCLCKHHSHSMPHNFVSTLPACQKHRPTQINRTLHEP